MSEISVAEQAKNDVQGLTLPAQGLLTEDEKKLQEQALEERKQLIGEKRFKKEQEQLKRDAELAEKGELNDAYSGANTEEMKARYEAGERLKEKVADLSAAVAVEEAKQPSQQPPAQQQQPPPVQQTAPAQQQQPPSQNTAVLPAKPADKVEPK